jgi:hypothetical protein
LCGDAFSLIQKKVSIESKAESGWRSRGEQRAKIERK